MALCWGSNEYGQLGDGTHFTSAVPVAVAGLDRPVIGIAAAAATTCVVLADRTVRCFGSNEMNRLGLGASPARPVPGELAGLLGFPSVLSTGHATTCLVVDGSALCLGNNWVGQVGDGTRSNRRIPTPVIGLPGAVTSIDAGAGHTCAVLAGGEVFCWGEGTQGQLGNGSLTSSPTPIQASLLAPAVAVSAGDAHTCARSAAGGVTCWGAGGQGELGDGGTSVSTVPVQPTGLAAGVIQVEAAAQFSCALRANGGVQCWGSNYEGRLGVGAAPFGLRDVPTDVFGLTTGVASIALGATHACAVMVSGELRCWGSNRSGQLSLPVNDVVSRYVPESVPGIGAGVRQVAAGGAHTCALLDDGRVKCWGTNERGQVGPAASSALQVEPLEVPLGGPAVSIHAGGMYSCARLATGRTLCWGDSSYGETGNGFATWSTDALPVILGDFSTSIVLTASPPASVEGQWIDLHATVMAADAVATGEISFYDGGRLMEECRPPHSANQYLQVGQASCRAALTRGTHVIEARYAGNGELAGSAGSTVHVVSPLPGGRCAGFDDVDAQDALCAHVEWIRNRSVSLGCMPNQFCPGVNVSRLSMAAFLNRLGRALTPEIRIRHHAGSHWADLLDYFCHVSIPPADYPRHVVLDAAFSGAGVGPQELDLVLNAWNGTTALVLGTGHKISMDGERVASARVIGAFDVPAGAAASASLDALPPPLDSYYQVNDVRCSLRATITSRDVLYAPFDEKR